MIVAATSSGKPHPLFAALYDPSMRALERAWLGERRAELLNGVTGRVLDVGAGTGANLPYYRVADQVVAAEPDPSMRRRLVAGLGRATVPVVVSDASAEALPFDDDTFDAVVFVLVLCTVEDPDRSLAEARRVLRPGGRLLVIEHVRGRDRLARWQDRITPLWRRLAAGCRPNRDTAAAIRRAGFTVDQLQESDPFPAPVPIRPMLEGVAMNGSAQPP